MLIKIVGSIFKGDIQVEPAATVADFRKLIAASSGLAEQSFKLLFKGKVRVVDSSLTGYSCHSTLRSSLQQMTDGAVTLQACGLADGKPVMLTSNAGAALETAVSPDKLAALNATRAREAEIARLKKAAVTLAGRKADHHYDRNHYVPEITNQNGQPLALPAADEEALKLGLLLHSRAAAVLKDTQRTERRAARRAVAEALTAHSPDTPTAAASAVASAVKAGVDAPVPAPAAADGPVSPSEQDAATAVAPAPAPATASVSISASSPSAAAAPSSCAGSGDKSQLAVSPIAAAAAAAAPPDPAAEIRAGYAMALALLLEADEAFGKAALTYRNMVDNVALLQLVSFVMLTNTC